MTTGTAAIRVTAPGAVYIVAGSSGASSSGDLDHPVMYVSLAELGSVVLDVEGGRMDVTFLRETGNIDDFFTIVKGLPPNQPPMVYAGSDAAAIHPAGLSLQGSVEDETPESTSVSWSKVSGPGSVSFVDAQSLSTSATFSAAGSYVLRLTADDGELSASDDILVVLYPPGTTNKAPIVNAGGDKQTSLSLGVSLVGSVLDDLLPSPPGEVTVLWSQVDGPGTASFASANALMAEVSFDAVGSYVLRLSASDGSLTGTDDVAVTVDDAPIVFEKRIVAGGR